MLAVTMMSTTTIRNSSKAHRFSLENNQPNFFKLPPVFRVAKL